MPSESCPHCQAPLGSLAHFCANCGLDRSQPAPRREQVASQDFDAEVRLDQRHLLAIVAIFAGTLGTLLVTFILDLDPWPDLLAYFAGYGLIAALALWLLGRPAWALSLGKQPTAKWLASGIGVGALGFAISSLYTWLLNHWASEDVEFEPELLPAIVGSLLLAPLAEELLDRGLLWTALSRSTSVSATITATAALFAITHGLNGGFVFEFPHRFAAGLLLGFLRHKSGSLAPCILAHFVWNALATWSPF